MRDESLLGGRVQGIAVVTFLENISFRKPSIAGGIFYLKEEAMVKLYRFDREIGAWVFFSWGVRNRIKEYTAQGYVVIYT